jgi:hypothetical protein
MQVSRSPFRWAARLDWNPMEFRARSEFSAIKRGRPKKSLPLKTGQKHISFPRLATKRSHIAEHSDHSPITLFPAAYWASSAKLTRIVGCAAPHRVPKPRRT